MNPYLIVVILNPTKKQKDEEGVNPVIIVQPQAVMAKDEQHATVKAMKFVPEEYSSQDDRLEVRVLPFRK